MKYNGSRFERCRCENFVSPSRNELTSDESAISTIDDPF